MVIQQLLETLSQEKNICGELRGLEGDAKAAKLKEWEAAKLKSCRNLDRR